MDFVKSHLEKMKWFALLLIKHNSHNKRFGEFEYFGGSDVANKLEGVS